MPRRAVNRFLSCVGVAVHTASGSSGADSLSVHKLRSAIVPRATIGPFRPLGIAKMPFCERCSSSPRKKSSNLCGGGSATRKPPVASEISATRWRCLVLVRSFACSWSKGTGLGIAFLATAAAACFWESGTVGGRQHGAGAGPP